MKRLLITLCTILIMNSFHLPAAAETENVENVDLHLKEDEVAVTFLPLSTGEAILFQNGVGESVLVNTGSSESFEELTRFLQIFHIQTLSAVVITRAEDDYKGNLDRLVANYKVKQVITNQSIFHLIQEEHPDVANRTKRWTVGSREELLKELTTEVLYDGTGVNEGLDLSFSYNHSQMVLLSSTSDSAAQAVMNHNLSEVHIVKIPAFGMKDSTNEELLEKMDPQMAIIFQKKGTEPDDEVLKSLQAAWIDTYYTKLNGLLTIKFTPTMYEIISVQA